MKERTISSRRLTVAVCAVLVIALISYLFHDLSSANRKTYDTMTAQKAVEQETIEMKAFVIRDEAYIDGEASGTVVPLVSDGNRVARGDAVARVCKSEEDAASYAALVEAKAERDRYIALANSTRQNAVDMEKLNSEIDECYAKLLKTASNLDYSTLSTDINELEDKLASKQILTDGSVSFDDRITEANELVADLEAKHIAPVEVAAPNSGYYISNIDGYENAVNYNEIVGMTVGQVEKLLESKPQTVEGKMGKIVGSYKWYIAANIDAKYEKLITAGKLMKINIPYYGLKNVAVTVESISPEADGKIALVLSCNLMNETYANIRNVDAELVIAEYSGYKIPATAPQTLKGGGKTFNVVYILRGNYMSARLIDIKYTPQGKDYIIVSDSTKRDYYEVDDEFKEGETKKIYLSPIGLYDEVIVKGRGLENGKSIG